MRIHHSTTIKCTYHCSKVSAHANSFTEFGCSVVSNNCIAHVETIRRYKRAFGRPASRATVTLVCCCCDCCASQFICMKMWLIQHLLVHSSTNRHPSLLYLPHLLPTTKNANDTPIHRAAYRYNARFGRHIDLHFVL